MEECSEIIRSHPGIVLTCEKPVTWRGLLIADPNFDFTVEIKLTVPNYPDLRDATLLFGQGISLLYSTGFEEKVVNLLENTSTVSSLLWQLKRIVAMLIKEKFGSCTRDIPNLHEGIVDELKAVLRLDTNVNISATTGLNAIKLSLNNVSVVLRKDTATNSWKVISSDLPELSWLEPFEVNIGNLSEAVSKLQAQVEMLQDTWDVLAEIDNTCWVVDPPHPKPYHLYRRINLSASLTAQITIDPINVTDLPIIKLLGCDNEVAKYRNIMSSNIFKWDPESTFADNIRILMAIDELPVPPELNDSRETDAAVEDDECCICFSMTLDDDPSGKLPAEICSNMKCKRHFHTSCLLQWLQSVAGNEIAFDRIHGNCPNCNEKISCSVLAR